MPRGVGEYDQAADPGRPVTRHLRAGPRKPVVPGEVFQVDAPSRRQAASGRQLARRARRVKKSQWICRPIRVAPKPVQLAAVDRVLNAVATGDLSVQERLSNRRLATKQEAIAKIPSPVTR